MKWIAALALILLAGCAFGPQPLLLTFPDGTCSGTAIAKHALLTATHCMDGKRGVMADGAPMTVLGRMDDGNDHTILIVGQSFDAHATFAPVPDLGQIVHILGNPATFRRIYAQGPVAGHGADGATLLDMQIFLGDSGAAVMDSQGRIVGVISGVRVMTGHGLIVQWAIAKPIKFSATQWREAGVE